MSAFIEQLGPLLYPLAALSLTAAAVIIERCLFFLSRRRAERSAEYAALAQELAKNAHIAKALRDEVLSFRLTEIRMRWMRGIQILRIIAVLSPMLGLLGTVTGMIDAFGDIAGHDGPVEPSIVAGGIESAMATTAYGLSVALPCLLAAFIFARAAEARLHRYRALLNAESLKMEGVTLL